MLLILMVCVLLLYFWRTEFFNNYYGVTATRDDVYGDAVQQELFVSLYGTIKLLIDRVKERLGLTIEF